MKLQTPSDLARLVKNARAQRNLTQQDVAHAVGITRQSLARIERGNAGVSFDTVLLILDHLGIHLDAITDRPITAPAGFAAKSAAQAAADALNKRVTPLIGSGALDALKKQIRGSMPTIDPALLPKVDLSLLPKIDSSGILTKVGIDFDPATLAAIRKASRELTERLAIPGSVLINAPLALEVSSATAAETQADGDQDDVRGPE